MEVQKLVGSVTWQDADDAESTEIERALLRDDAQTLVLDFLYDGLRYNLVMTRSGANRFSGSCQLANAKEKWTVKASGRLYSYGTEYALVGTWNESGAYQWLVELEDVDQFPDEPTKA